MRFTCETEVKLEGKMVDASGIVASLSAGQGSPIEVEVRKPAGGFNKKRAERGWLR